jgi:acyl carrier protein
VAALLPAIFSILRQVLRDSDLELTPATRFDDLAGWDSMDLLTLVVELEYRLGLQFELAEIDRLVTVTDLFGQSPPNRPAKRLDRDDFQWLAVSAGVSTAGAVWLRDRQLLG